MKNKKVREKQRKEAEYLKNPDKLLNEVRKLESTAGGKKKAQQQVRENVLKVGVEFNHPSGALFLFNVNGS